ncbi:protein-tyrosine-phosphatase [Flavobacterium sp.]|uniref:protein-tyrosine-phosphatase n=1 Tax=Flavobacterium sp. TaxID=239 RepID=UPI0026124C0A|nr:protein-tyrosine-phosphatase [Flavobacterium sp.]
MNRYPILTDTIRLLEQEQTISRERKTVLQPLIDYIQQKVTDKQAVNLIFICTHNSRRSIFSQVWAQVAASRYGISNVYCYSGGTEVTAVFPKVIETLSNQGFNTIMISEENNSVYAIKYSDTAFPVIGFSKKYDHFYNPVSEFGAVMTCSEADGGCPFIAGAEKRIAITYEDPGFSDSTPEQSVVYASRSLQIATEMLYVFSMIKLT